MKTGLSRWLLISACTLLTACAVITVNVYFPEKAAKEAYKSLDEMLLKTDEGKTAPEGDAPSGAPAEPRAKQQDSLLKGLKELFVATEAHAADNEAEQLAVELSSMPEVLKAYDDMSKRLPRLTQLFATGVVGLSNQGLVSVRDKTKVTGTDEGLVAAENQDRKTVITAMAKAILKLNKQKESKAAMDQVLPKAAATYADTKREAAERGWWVQLQNGRWVQK